MAVDDHNSLLVTPEGLKDALKLIANDVTLCQRLADNGYMTAQNFSWEVVENKFVDICREKVRS